MVNTRGGNVVYRPRENTLAHLLRKKLEEAHNRSAAVQMGEAPDNMMLENDATTLGGSSMMMANKDGAVVGS